MESNLFLEVVVRSHRKCKTSAEDDNDNNDGDGDDFGDGETKKKAPEKKSVRYSSQKHTKIKPEWKILRTSTGDQKAKNTAEYRKKPKHLYGSSI